MFDRGDWRLPLLLIIIHSNLVLAVKTASNLETGRKVSYTLRSSRQFVMSKKNLIIVQVTSAMFGRYLQKSKKQAKNVTKKEKEEAIIRAYYQAQEELCEKRSAN